MKKIKEQLEVDFNRQAEVSQNLQETINQKNLQIEGLQNNNSVQRETIDELHNEVGILKEAIELQKNDVTRYEKRIQKLQTQIASSGSPSSQEGGLQIDLQEKEEMIESLKNQLSELKKSRRNDSVLDDSTTSSPSPSPSPSPAPQDASS